MFKRELAPAVDNADELKLNAQAVLDFTLIGTNLKMAFSKTGDVNTFIVIPISKEPSKGMSIQEMINDINKMLKDYDPTMDSGIQADDISEAIKDVDQAAKTKTEQAIASNIDYKNIKIALRQAFLLISTGKPAEYALEIAVDLTGLFPKEQSFVNVERLSIGVWNTKREKILKMMNIVEVSALLEEHAG